MSFSEDIMLKQYFDRGFKSLDFSNYLLYRDFGKYRFKYSSIDIPVEQLSPFGCTAFRKGNFVGRSYDFYKNHVASIVVHSSAIDNERYESIGTVSCSNWLIRDNLISGLFPDIVNETLLGFTVDGINEKGLCVCVLVVPRGDKGITTGTNPDKERLSSICVARYLLDKADSVRSAISLLSERNIYQPWDKYELHWMISDMTETYVVETVDNSLSYLGPEEIVDIDGYNGTLEENVITNFYITDFVSDIDDASTFTMPITNPTVTPHACGLERYKQLTDSLVTKNPHLDTGAIKIIKEVSYSQLYNLDNTWYTDFVGGDFTVSSDISEGSDFMNMIDKVKSQYNDIKDSDKKLRSNGNFWHSNHQCGFNMNKKTMLICASESDKMFRIHIDGSIERL